METEKQKTSTEGGKKVTENREYKKQRGKKKAKLKERQTVVVRRVRKNESKNKK